MYKYTVNDYNIHFYGTLEVCVLLNNTFLACHETRKTHNCASLQKIWKS